MAPRLKFYDWLGKQKCEGTAVADVGGAEYLEFCLMGKGRGRNARQITWMLLLKAHRIIGCVAWMTAALLTLLRVFKGRLIFQQGVSMESEKPGKGRILFSFIRGFCMVSLAALVLDMVAYCNGWHFHIPHTAEVQGWMHSVYLSWTVFRAN
ncbi:putative xyloglucan 6-xylosyltransferase [Dioscorea sansibarensis]